MKLWVALLLSLLLIMARHVPIHKDVLDNSIVKVINLDMTAGGTGFEIMYHGYRYTVTNSHVCELANGDNALQASSATRVPVKLHILAKRGGDTDLCILEPLTNPYSKPFVLATKDLPPLQPVTVIGYPHLNPLHTVKGTTWIKQEVQMDEGRTVYGQYIRADIQPGNSGSPVFDSEGYIRGVVFAGNDHGLGVMIPVSKLKEFLDAYQHKGL